MVLSCNINFDQNAHGVYFAGQMLSGRVHITLDKPKKLKGVCLLIEGKAAAKWSEHELRKQGGPLLRPVAVVEYKGRVDYLSTTTYLVPFRANGVRIQIAGQARTRWNERVHRFVDGRPEKKELFYQADETFLDSKAYLRKGADDEGAMDALIELPAGQHTYTFACALPPMLPTSFEGQFGHIRYTVKVVLERPWKFDQTYKVAFTVLKELDLNLLSPILRIPTQVETSNSFWCGPCTTGQMTIVASIPQSGYVPGQNIAITAEVTNMSHIPVDYMRFSLRKVVLYKSQIPATKTKLELDVVQERRTGNVGKKDQRRFEVCIAIPPIPPTNTNLCKVIEIAYEVKVEAKVPAPHKSPFVLMPVTIGTVPLNRNTPDPKTPSIVTAPAAICEQPSPTQSQPPLPVDQLAAPPLYSIRPPRLRDGTGGGLGGRAVGQPDVNGGTSAAQQPIIGAITNAQRQQLNNIPPPSYEESLRGNHIIEDEEDEQHPIGQQPYTPRYVVYNFNAPIRPQVEVPAANVNASPASTSSLTATPAAIIETNGVLDHSQLTTPAAFTMTIPESRRAAMQQEPDIGLESVIATRSSSEGVAGDRTSAENERHAAKLRANMDTWT